MDNNEKILFSFSIDSNERNSGCYLSGNIDVEKIKSIIKIDEDKQEVSICLNVKTSDINIFNIDKSFISDEISNKILSDKSEISLGDRMIDDYNNKLKILDDINTVLNIYKTDFEKILFLNDNIRTIPSCIMDEYFEYTGIEEMIFGVDVNKFLKWVKDAKKYIKFKTEKDVIIEFPKNN